MVFKVKNKSLLKITYFVNDAIININDGQYLNTGK